MFLYSCNRLNKSKSFIFICHNKVRNWNGNVKNEKYTLEELKDYNGKNGKIYIVYQGQVYDVTDSYLWEGGTHQGLHDAGQGLTEAMDDAPHEPDVLKGYPVVETLNE
jgi:predicted heme/steroid binding protein